MRRLPPPWLSEDTAPDRSAAHAIGMSILRVYHVQPWGLHPALSPERGHAISNSGAGFLELEPSAGTHLPPTITHASGVYLQTLSLSQSNPRSQAVARRSKRVQKGTELAIAGTAATSGGTSLLLLFVTTHCLDHLWTRPADDPPPTTQPPPPAHIATDSLFAQLQYMRY